jgi:competence protein ComEC
MDGACGTTSQQVRLGPLARRPALTAATALIVGILLHRVLPDLPRAWLALAAAGAVAALALPRFGVTATTCLATALVLLGASAAQLDRFHFAPDDIAHYTADAARLAEVEIELDQPPRVLTAPPGAAAGRPLPPRQVTAGVVRRVRTVHGWRDAAGRALVQISPPRRDLAHGQRVRLLGILSRPPPAMNPGQFDWARYYRAQRVLASIDVADAGTVRVLAPGGGSTLQWLRDRARAALATGFTKNQSLDHALLRALLLGDPDPQLRDVQDDFQRTGTSHHLAISGMHVALLAAVVYFCCRLARLSPRRAAFTMMAFVLLYGLVALPAPPVVRSIVLCLCVGVGLVAGRAVDGVQLLAVTVFAMLLAHPLDLENAGFQLSFLTVLGLMLYATPLRRRLDRHDPDQQALLAAGIPPTRMQSARNWLKGALLASLATGLVAWAVSAPLIVQHFDQLNPWAVPAGMLMAIPVFLAMIGGLLKIVLTLALPWFAPAWALLAAQPVALMRWLVARLADVPGSDVPLPALPIVLVLLYYAAIALPLIPTARQRLKWVFRGGAATACATALMLPVLIGFAPRDGGGDGASLRVTLLSVGAGQCAVVQTPTGKTFLIDAGSSTTADLDRRCLEPFLRRMGVRRLDGIYVSHANLDHFSAVATAAERYAVRDVRLTPTFTAHAVKNLPAKQMLRRLDELKCAVTTVAAGDRVQLDDDCALDVLWPAAATDPARLDPNESSSVLRLSCRGRTILFTGDVQRAAQSALLADPANLRADVLIAPHHGSAEPQITARFLAAVGATTVLASNDRTPSGKQREFDKLLPPDALLRTHRTGAITVRVTKTGGLETRTFLPR